MDFEEFLSEGVPLGPMTSLRVGGPARYFADVSTVDELRAGVHWARTKGMPLFVLGGGSNVVIADEGFAGLVLRNSIKGVKFDAGGDVATIDAGAGEDWDSLVEMTVEHGWAGFECLSGIPGRVGATPVQNVGAYGQETSETLLSVEAFDLNTGETVQMDRAECEFGYRTSRFKTRDKNRFVITSVRYGLRINGDPAIKYAELERHLKEKNIASPSLSQTRNAVIEIRRNKSMVIDVSDPDSQSAGSFFVNPVLSSEQFSEARERASHQGVIVSAMPGYPQRDGNIKVPAAWLIERAGIPRGFVLGNAGTSSRHALAIINRGSANARDLIELMELIRNRVREVFGVTLVPEPVFVGFEKQ